MRRCAHRFSVTDLCQFVDLIQIQSDSMRRRVSKKLATRAYLTCTSLDVVRHLDDHSHICFPAPLSDHAVKNCNSFSNEPAPTNENCENRRPQIRVQRRCHIHSRIHCKTFKPILSRTDPATGRPLKDRTLVPNDNLRQLIADLAPSCIANAAQPAAGPLCPMLPLAPAMAQ